VTGQPSGEPALEVVEERADNVHVIRVTLCGEIDLADRPALDQLVARVRAAAATVLSVDVAAVTYLDSTALAALVAMATVVRARGGSCTLLDPAPVIRRLIEITDLGSHLEVRSAEDRSSNGTPEHTQ
jgi:anti-sigma B factor antagonist